MNVMAAAAAQAYALETHGKVFTLLILGTRCNR